MTNQIVDLTHISTVPGLAETLVEHGYTLQGEGEGYAIVSKGSLTPAGFASIDYLIQAIDAEGDFMTCSATVHAYGYGTAMGAPAVRFGPSTSLADPTYLRAYAAILSHAADVLASLQAGGPS